MTQTMGTGNHDDQIRRLLNVVIYTKMKQHTSSVFPEARKESTSAHVASSPTKYMCHFILELHLILNYLSASSLRKGHFKQASGMILTLHPIKDSQEV